MTIATSDDREQDAAWDAACAAPHRAAMIWAAFGLTLILAVWWLCAKFVLFDALEYTCDLFSALELTWTWADGRPLLFENSFGDHKPVHNYYLLPLLYPATAMFGARGLFLVQCALNVIATFAL